MFAGLPTNILATTKGTTSGFLFNYTVDGETDSQKAYAELQNWCSNKLFKKIYIYFFLNLLIFTHKKYASVLNQNHKQLEFSQFWKATPPLLLQSHPTSVLERLWDEQEDGKSLWARTQKTHINPIICLADGHSSGVFTLRFYQVTTEDQWLQCQLRHTLQQNEEWEKSLFQTTML